MIIFPAIDIKDGKVVRLLQGKFDEVTEYAQDPLIIAKAFEDKGAKWIHVIDLDGAQTGTMRNQDIIIKIAQSVSIPIQVGGGIRSKKSIAQLIEGGVGRVVLGTKAIEDRNFLAEMISKWKDKIAVSLDCADGFVATHGWKETSEIKALDLVKELEQIGLTCLIYTDIATDGMLTGPNFKSLDALCEATKIPIIASGGISNIEDIKKLLTFKEKGIIGAITGKAVYEGKLDLKEALSIC